MPQEHYVLRCFSCGTFQAHIVKKTKKWECKICGAKQSVKRNYGRGSAKDCRNQVMKLNELRLRNECSFNETEAGFSDDDLVLPELKIQFDSNKPFNDKWEKYLDKPATDPEDEVDDSKTDFSVEMKKKRMIKMPENYSNNSKKVCWESNPNEVSPSVKGCLLSPISYEKNMKRFKTEEKVMEKESPVQSKNKLKLSKYAKYMDNDEGHINDIDIVGDAGGDFKVSKCDVTIVKKSLSVFDSEPTDLNKILSFE